MKKLFLILFLAILLVGTVAAADWDNKLSYSNNDLRVDFRNSFLGIIPTSDIGSIELKSHSSVDEVLKVGYGKEEVVMWYDFDFIKLYKNGLGEVTFTDMRKGKEIQRDYFYVYWGESQRDVYRCEYTFGLNGTKICNEVVIGKENYYDWLPYNSEDIPQGNIRIGIMVDVKLNDYVDGIWNVVGKKVSKHAAWENVNLVANYELDGLSGVVVDSSGNGYDGVNNGTIRGIIGIKGYAFNFTNDANVNLDHGLTTLIGDTGGNWSISGWFNTATQTNDYLMGLRQSTPNAYLSIILENGKLSLSYYDDGSSDAFSNEILNDSIWHHFVFTQNADENLIELWIDNVKQADTGEAMQSRALTSDFYLGVENDLKDGRMDGPYEGLMDSVRFFNKTLNDSEIDSLYQDAYAPKITLNFPVDVYNTTNLEITFNSTVLVFDNELVNVSFILNNSYYSTNSSGLNASNYINTLTLPIGTYNWTYEACPNESVCVNATIRTFTVSSFIEEGIFYNLETYETSEETFTINITTNGSQTTSAEFFYNDISQGASTKTGTDSNANFSNTIQIPTSNGSKEFYWNITVGSSVHKTIVTNQSVDFTTLGLCNATLTVPYINFTFKDEETASNLNATIDSSTWSYWLGDGTYKKSLLFSNTTENGCYAFCLYPGNKTLHNTRSIQYASAGYPQRKYDASSDLTSATTNQTLYLLSSADGIYSTIQVVDQDGDKVADIEVTVERDFVGVPTIVGQEITDDAGLVTFWINPDYDHTFTFVGDSCTGVTVTIRPTQTQYTQQLQCGVSDEIYVSQLEGIKYSRTPATGIIQAGTYNFTYQIVSSKDNIVNASFKIVNASDDTVLNSTWSACTSSGCIISFLYTVSLGEDIKGKYYFNIGNGSTLLEGDARWRCIDIPTAGKAGIKTFFQDMKYVINEWGDDTDTADFNRIVIIFFFMCLGISTLNYHFGNDTSNPGAFLVIMTFVILMGSIVGGSTGQGFFYFNNLTGNSFINNYILAFFTLIITTSYFINVNRQAQR